MRLHAQGHLDIQLKGAGDRTSNHPVTSHPALPPELQLPKGTTVDSPLHGHSHEKDAQHLLIPNEFIVIHPTMKHNIGE